MNTTAKKPGLNFDFLQKLGKVLMTVIAVMPAAGFMLSLGKLIQMTGAGIPFLMIVGGTMENIGWAIINNLHILFAVNKVHLTPALPFRTILLRSILSKFIVS